jgi:hypothetical protein
MNFSEGGNHLDGNLKLRDRKVKKLVAADRDGSSSSELEQLMGDRIHLVTKRVHRES